MRFKTVLLGLLLLGRTAAGAAEVTNATSVAFGFCPSGAAAAAAASSAFGFVAPGQAVSVAETSAFGYVRAGESAAKASYAAFCFALPGTSLAEAASADFGYVSPGAAVVAASSVPCGYHPAGSALASASSAPFAFGETMPDLVLCAAFDGFGVVIRTDDGYRVTLTNDFVGTAILPDNLGLVEIDLAGHVLKGADGADGTEAEAGQDGAAASVIAASGEEGPATHLVFIDSCPDDEPDVVGGDGGNGNPPGKGGKWAVIEPDARQDASVDVGQEVTWADGKDGEDLSVPEPPPTIDKTVVPVPVVSAKTYDGTPQVADVAASDSYQVTANAGGTDAGAYEVVLTLTDPANCQWPGTESSVTSLVFKIEPKPLSESMVGLLENRYYTGDAQTPVPSVADVAPCQVGQNDRRLEYANNVGIGTASVTVVGVRNYCGRIVRTFEIVAKTVQFNAMGGSPAAVTLAEIPGRPYVLPTEPVWAGHDFVGWYSAPSGGAKIDSSTLVSAEDADVAYARWSAVVYTVNLDLGGGESRRIEVTCDSTYPSLPEPTRPGYCFGGWYLTPDCQGGTEVGEGTPVRPGVSALYPKWTRRSLWDEVSASLNLETAAVWDGYVLDEDEKVAGTVQVKVGKPGREGKSKVTASVRLLGEKSQTIKTEALGGMIEASAKDGRVLSLQLDAAGMKGHFAGLYVEGSRNVFDSREPTTAQAAALRLRRCRGSYSVLLEDALGCYGGLTMSVGAKGVVKVSGVLPDGAKVTGSSQLLFGERECAVAFAWEKKAASVSFLVWFCEDGRIELANAGGDVAEASIARLSSGVRLASGATFRMDSAPLVAALGTDVLTGAFLPDGTSIVQEGTKWRVDKPGKVSVKKGKLVTSGSNLSGLNLTYSAKDSTFKGSFTVYVLTGGKLKKMKADVAGVLVDGVGYGTATVKKLALRMPVMATTESFP